MAPPRHEHSFTLNVIFQHFSLSVHKSGLEFTKYLSEYHTMKILIRLLLNSLDLGLGYFSMPFWQAT